MINRIILSKDNTFKKVNFTDNVKIVDATTLELLLFSIKDKERVPDKLFYRKDISSRKEIRRRKAYYRINNFSNSNVVLTYTLLTLAEVEIWIKKVIDILEKNKVAQSDIDYVKRQTIILINETKKYNN